MSGFEFHIFTQQGDAGRGDTRNLRLLGSTGTAVVARVTGLVLTALAVQVMIVGFQNVFPASL
jgi:hypothetical protein